MQNDDTDAVLNRNPSELLLLMTPDTMVCEICHKIFFKKLNLEISAQCTKLCKWEATCIDCLICIKAMQETFFTPKQTLKYLLENNISLEKIEKVFGNIYKVSLVSADLSFEKIEPNE